MVGALVVCSSSTQCSTSLLQASKIGIQTQVRVSDQGWAEASDKGWAIYKLISLPQEDTSTLTKPK